MPNYIQITFENIQSDTQEMLIAVLAESGFDGFEEIDNTLKAFISEEQYDKESLNSFLEILSIPFKEKIIPEQNWNQLWESNFQPVVVENFVGIRAYFHEPIKNVAHEIIITPKMSFGTGHHATTYMMIQAMQKLDFTSKSVFDFGTGTGVLAILAEKLGAKDITAVDNDEWSISNAQENINENKCSKIKIEKSNSLSSNTKYDIILANINKNVILENLYSLSMHLNDNGILLLSGLLSTDEQEILLALEENFLIFSATIKRDNWICLQCNK